MGELSRMFVQRLFSLFRRRRLENDLDDELRSHLEMAVELNVRKGMSGEDARREALKSFGGVEQTKENYRDQRGLPMIDATVQDLRFGFRMLRRNPGFSMLAILCLTLGIGANAAVFSWVEGILFRPYPAVAHQEQLFALTGTARGESDPTGISWPDLLDLQRSCTLFDSFIVTKIMGTTLSIGDRAEVTTGSIVSANYFDAIGVHPILGRGFEPGEDSGVTRKSSGKRSGSIMCCTPLLASRHRVFMGPSWVGPCSSGSQRRWRKTLKQAATNWRIAARDGLKLTCDSSPARLSRRRSRRFPPSRRHWRMTIRQPTAAVASSCGHYGKRHSTMRTRCSPRSKLCSPWLFSSCSSRARTSAIFC